jgi:hypothetical protein
VSKAFTVGGAAEKDILEDPETGALYIAKLGGKNGETEVITEYVIHLIGRSLGIKVADAQIAVFRGRLRFLSRYFLDPRKPEELIHGVQLFRELYDETAVKAVLGDELSEQAMFSVQAVKAAFGAHYLHYGSHIEDELFDGFVSMLTHDAMIGVQDRHHENWGVIVQRGFGSDAPRFAPLYDSARGLFCNETEMQLLRFLGTGGSQRLDGFVARSRPLIGFTGLNPVDGRKYLTHTQLLTAVFHEYPKQRERILSTLASYDWEGVRDEILKQLAPACSSRRTTLILTCLRRRIRALQRHLAVQ